MRMGCAWRWEAGGGVKAARGWLWRRRWPWAEKKEVAVAVLLGAGEDKGRWGMASSDPVAPRDGGGRVTEAPKRRCGGERRSQGGSGSGCSFGSGFARWR